MIGSLGTMELVVIGVVALIVFGPRKLPELGRSLGKSLQEFRRASNELKHTLEEEISLEEREAARAKTPPPAAALPFPVDPTPSTDSGQASPDPATGEFPADPAVVESPVAPETVARGQQ